MPITRSRILPLVILAALRSLALAAELPDEKAKAIPEPLRAWEAWATWGEAHRDCPTPWQDSRKHFCFWPSRLALQIDRTGARFDLGVTVFHETWVPLPGGPEVWPQEVKAGGVPLAVLEHDGQPAVHLAAGTYELEGVYHWTDFPQRISLPREIGILALTIDGKPVEAPAWDAQGLLWLKRDGSAEEADKDFLGVKIYAAIEDGIPLWLRTEIELTVSGKSREEDLGSILPDGWKLAAVESPIPVAVDDAGRMKAQVRAGKWTIHTDAFRSDNPKEVRFAAGAKPAAKEELIAFSARPDFRVVEISGIPSIDVSQTTFPEQWRDLPVYRWDTATPFRIEERLRGMGEQKPAGLNIARELWLDENGRGLTFRDFITGQLQQIWRLDTAAGQDLGAVRSDGKGQLITRNPQTAASGVEIRTRNLNLEATGRMAREAQLSATGWRTDADSVRVTLNLPPGWRLLALFGADWVSGDWLTAWTLLDLFLLLVFTLAVFRLWGLAAAALAFFAFGLSYHEAGAPRYIWLILLVPLALQRVVPAGWGRRLVSAGKWIALAGFVIILAPFIAGQVEQALYPQLERVEQERFMTHARASVAAQRAAPAPVETASERVERLQRKLERIIIPKLELHDATVAEAIDYLRTKSVELDSESSTGVRGVNIVLKLDAGGGNSGAPQIPGLEALPNVPNSADARITVSLTNIPLSEALRYVTNLGGLKYKVEADGVVVVPASVNTETVITKEYKVRPDLIGRNVPENTKAAAPGGSGIAKREAAKDWLIANGVTFGPSASAIYIPSSNKLIVRNTQEQLDLVESIFSAGESANGLPPSGNLNYDAKARIQTGPGVPVWAWRETSFGWNGPVIAAQQVHPILISLAVERVLTVLRIVSLLALAAVLLEARRLGGAMFRAPGKVVAILCLAAVTIGTASAQSPIPDKATLDTLRARLLETSDAYPHAAEIPSVTLALHDRKVVIDAEIHTALRTAVPLPGKLPAWSPLSVRVDDQAEVALRREDGYLWVVLPAGVHRVHVEALLAGATEWEWTFALKPRQVKIDAPGWTVTGVRPDGTPEAQVFFALQQKTAAGAATYERQDLQSIVTVERYLELGLIWQITTRVERLSPTGKAIALRIPLLPGENVLSSNAVVKDGFIEVRLGAQESWFDWESSLAVTSSVKLATRPEDEWVEHWRLFASPVWNVTISGLAPIFSPDTDALMPVWQPWPGETAELKISRPEAITGATVTVSKGEHEISLGRRQRVSKLDLSLQCSVGEDFLVELPADAEVTTLTQNGKAIPVRKDGGKLIVPVFPGEQSISMKWKINTPLGFRTVAEEVRLPVESANTSTTIHVPDDRWVLWAQGPLRGPAVRFWGILICSLLAALALGRSAQSPLRTVEWMLLVIGLTQVPLTAAMVVVGWLFFLGWRGRESFQSLGWKSYDALQILLIALTAGALGILVTAVGEGLLGSPEMFITGNGSSHTFLRWFQARCEPLLPRPGCLSISIWWYRLLMLAWALWLATALIRWLRQGWQHFSSGGFFHRKPKAPAAPPPLPVAQ